MSMQCSSIFPRCTEPQSRDEPMPFGGRVPMCLHLCVFPLIMCPGFWVGDVAGPCSMVSVPPACTQAVFANLAGHCARSACVVTVAASGVWQFRLPPQYASYDEANAAWRWCDAISHGPCESEPRHTRSRKLALAGRRMGQTWTLLTTLRCMMPRLSRAACSMRMVELRSVVLRPHREGGSAERGGSNIRHVSRTPASQQPHVTP